MKMAMKSQWMRIVAVAAAAACAVTATAVGANFPMTKVDAADGDIAYLRAHDNNWAIKATNDSFNNSVVMTGDGTYSLTVTNENTYAASAWDTGEMALVLQEDWRADNATAYTEVTIDSVVFPNATYENVPYTVKTGDYPEYIDSNGKPTYLYYSAVFILDTSVFTNGAVNVGESVTINFTIGGKVEETTTTTITTTTDTDDTTTTTTTITTTDTDDTATTTTTDTDYITDTTTSDTDDTTTTTSTTTTVDTTTTTTTSDTTTTTTTTVTLDTKIDFTQQTGVGNDGSKFAYVEFDPAGADSVTVVYKVLSSDNNTTVSFGTWTGEEWLENKYPNIAVPSNKLVTQSSDIPSNVGETMKISVYWPSASSVQFVSVTLHYNEPPVVTTTTTTTTATTTTIAGDKVPTYTTTIGIKDKTNKEEIQIDLNDIVYVVVSAEGQVGKKISGAMYAGGDEIVWQDEIVDETGLYIIDYVNVNREAFASYQIYYNNGQDVTNVSYKAYKRYDASLNDKVNASDILAILKYIRGTEKNTVQDIVCDINEDGVVKMNDAVALVKYILGTETAE